MGQLAKSRELMLATSRMVPAQHTETVLLELAEDCDWNWLVQTAYDHGVAGLLCNSLLQIPESLVPADILEAAQTHLSRCRSSNQALADQLTRILVDLRAHGIEAIPFKGPTLALSAYGDLALRSFRDLDFLIHEEHIHPCLERLSTLGYAQDTQLSPRQMQAFLAYSGQDILYGHGVPVEPHWAIAPTTLALDIDYGGLWERARHYRFNSQQILRFAPEDELIILCVHGSKEKWTKLKWVADIAEYLRSHPNLNWGLLFARAETQRLARMVILGLALADRLLEAPLPPTAVDRMNQDRFAIHWSGHLAETFFEVEKRQSSIYEPSRFHWDMRERYRDRWHYLIRTLTQPRKQHFMSVNFPDRLFFLFTPYKLLHDYLALPLWWLLKKVYRTKPTEQPTGSEHTDATR